MGLSPNGGSVGSPLQLPDDYFAVPSSSEDEEHPTRGGWKLVETKVSDVSFYRIATVSSYIRFVAISRSSRKDPH